MSVAETVPVAAPAPFVYQRHRHYAEWLRRAQGQVIGPGIPAYVVAAVAQEMAENQSEVTPQCVRRALKVLHLTKYVHQVPELMHRIYGIEPIRIDPLLQQELVRRVKVLCEIGCQPVSYEYLTAKLLASIDADDLRPLIDYFCQMARCGTKKWFVREQYVGAFFDKLLWPNVSIGQ